MSSLLLIDDDLSAVESLARALSAALEGVSLFIATDPEKALQIAVRERPAVVVLDLCLVPAQGVESGFSLLQKLLYEDPHLRIIVLTGHGDTEFGVRSMKLGASNFLVKPASIPHLSALVDEALRQSVLLKQLESHTKREEERKLHEFLIGDSRPMKELREQLRFLAGTVQPVLIEGETGVGKSLCARLLHQLS
ncbi:response regulator, partial [bacterium]|nr:response regulator [bacterium]